MVVVGSNACNVYFKLQVCHVPMRNALRNFLTSQVTFCGDLLVDYCLKLMRSAIANASLTLGQCTSVQNGSCDADIIAHLQPNAEYTYIITASNVIGNATTSAQTLCEKRHLNHCSIDACIKLYFLMHCDSAC